MKISKPIATSIVGAIAAISLAATVASAASSNSAASNVAAGACNDQPNMAAALSQLRGARASLGIAEHNKGGWRDNAIKAADNAIAETARGCAMAR